MTTVEFSHFGPPSGPIDVVKLTDAAKHLSTQVAGQTEWLALSDERRAAVEAECSVSDIKNSLMTQWTTPSTHAHLTRSLEVVIGNVHGEAESTSNRKKRKRAPAPDAQIPAVKALQANLDMIHLRSWPLPSAAALFMRPGKMSDSNVLTSTKKSPDVEADQLTPTSTEALITMTIHHRIPWSPSVTAKGSQHVFLSSHSLGDVFETIPCPSNEIPTQLVDENRHVTGYEEEDDEESGSSGAVILLDGIAYGDGQSEDDYADKLLTLLATKPLEKRSAVTKSPNSMHDTLLSSLALKINEPYWLLHQGSCEHFIIVDQVRLPNANDPTTGYPLTLHITPQSIDLCRACSKVPAVQSIIGDIRLGDSPCLMCTPCWRNMGTLGMDKDVVVVPLPKHELGW